MPGKFAQEPDCPDLVAQTVKDIYGKYRLRRAVRTRCINRFANAEPCNVVPIRAGFECLTLRCTSCGLGFDAQTTPILKGRCSGLARYRASVAEVRSESSEGKRPLFSSPNSH